MCLNKIPSQNESDCVCVFFIPQIQNGTTHQNGRMVCNHTEMSTIVAAICVVQACIWNCHGFVNRARNSNEMKTYCEIGYKLKMVAISLYCRHSPAAGIFRISLYSCECLFFALKINNFFGCVALIFPTYNFNLSLNSVVSVCACALLPLRK